MEEALTLANTPGPGEGDFVQASKELPHARLPLQGNRLGAEKWREEEAGECSHGGR